MSQGLEALKRMAEHIRQADYDKENLEDYDVLQFVNDYQAIEKELKALEIIKEKNVNVWILVITNDVGVYNASIPNNMVKQLTSEEFDLLKEVLL